MVLKLNLIVAVCENRGIGLKNRLPWQLKSELEYFQRMSTETVNPNKRNVVLMGRKNWDSIPVKYRPLPGRINMVLTRNPYFQIDDDEVIVLNSFKDALNMLQEPEMQTKIEEVWVIGGSDIYKEAMNSKFFYRLYITEIMAKFECDTFMPPLVDNIELTTDERVPVGVQEENGIKFMYKVYENKIFNNK